MGIKLTEIVPKKEIDFETLKKKKIAVDSSNMLYQFVSSIRQSDGTPLQDSEGNTTSHLMGMFTRITNLMQKEIKLAFVFDGKPPILKITEQEQRQYRKQMAEVKLKQAIEDEDVSSMLKYSKQTTRLSREMIEESKEFLKALGLPVIQAPSEAEAQASYMCKNNDVYAVASSDFDSLVYGCPRFIQNLTISQRRKTPSGIIFTKPFVIELKDVLEELKLNQEQLLTLSILVGTDYNNKGVPGIGPKKALKLVQEVKDPEKIFSQFKDLDFDWKEIRDTFLNMKLDKHYHLEWKDVDEDKVKEILIEKHDFNPERVENTLNKLTKKSEDKKQKGLKDFF